MSVKKTVHIKRKTTIDNKQEPTEYSDLSLRMTKELSLDVKKDNGIYFTPYSTVKHIIDRIEAIPGFSYGSVLEPSCGTGQFLEHLTQCVTVTAVEINNDIYSAIKERFPIATIRNGDFLTMDFTGQKFDLIIGNPPYFVVPKTIVQKKYAPYVTGRPNIYILFILKSLDLLTENGVLAFVLPNNFMNCHYYNKLRELIYSDYTIVDIIPQKNAAYIDTEQNTCVFILQNRLPANGVNDKFRVNMTDFTVFNTPDLVHKINDLLKGTTTLAAMGYDVNVGKIVWNQCKKILTDDNTQTRLIYSSDITEGSGLTLSKFTDPEKKHYIHDRGTRDTVLLVNRGYGKGKYVFKYCLLENPEFPYLVENHVICIYGPVDNYRVIIDSFNDPRTLEFVDLYFENNAINTTELKYIIPIRN